VTAGSPIMPVGYRLGRQRDRLGSLRRRARVHARTRLDHAYGPSGEGGRVMLLKSVGTYEQGQEPISWQTYPDRTMAMPNNTRRLRQDVAATHFCVRRASSALNSYSCICRVSSSGAKKPYRASNARRRTAAVSASASRSLRMAPITSNARSPNPAISRARPISVNQIVWSWMRQTGFMRCSMSD
jgi:hypothetical protein